MKVEYIPLLRKAVEWVEEQDAHDEETREWMQREFILPEEERIEEFGHEPGCGTAMCVAGFLGIHLAPETYKSTWAPEGRPTVASFVQEELGITYDEAWDLFDGGNTAADVRAVAEKIAGQSL